MAGLAVDEVPAELRRRFASFRQMSGPRAFVPVNLRQAVLDVLGRGCSMRAVRRDLGLTAKQVEGWRRAADASAPVEGSPVASATPARVFAVGDGAAVDEARSARVEANEALEVRLGAWSLVIRRGCP